MRKFCLRLRDNEIGAVTVDWVILTAALVGIAAVAYDAVSENTMALGDVAADRIESQLNIASGSVN